MFLLKIASLQLHDHLMYNLLSEEEIRLEKKIIPESHNMENFWNYFIRKPNGTVIIIMSGI